MASRVAALLLLGVIVGFAAAQTMEDCCLQTSPKPFPRQILSSYSMSHEAGKGCKIRASVFISKAGRTMCAPHRDDAAWVQELVTFLEKRREKSKH